MIQNLSPIRAESLKDVFISKFEALILSGELTVGRKLPSERELALQLGVSRPVVHEGLVELAAKGLVSIKPRSGWMVNDYRREGSPAILASLINYRQGRLDQKLLDSILEMRFLFETETARLAAAHRTEEQLAELRDVLRREAETKSAEAMTGLDFEFHHLVALASGNMLYPLMINTFKQIHYNLAGIFFKDQKSIEAVKKFHHRLTDAVAAFDETGAVGVMQEMLAHGRRGLEAVTQDFERSPK